MNSKYFIAFILLSSCDMSTEIYKEGKVAYLSKCASCHGDQAEGFGTLYPNLKDINYIKENRSTLPCLILYGIGPGPEFARNTRFSDQLMPPLKDYPSIEICNILNYLNHKYWKMPEFNIAEIERLISECK